MPAEFLSGILPRLFFSSDNITLIDGAGQFSKGGTLNLFIQGRNRAGYTLPSVAIAPINYNASQAIQITFPPQNRTSATDFHYYIVSHSSTGKPEDAIALFHWRNYELDQLTTRVLLPITLFRDEHVAIAPSVALPTDLPSGADLKPGMHRLIVGGVATSAYYQYDPFETRNADSKLVVESHPGEKWTRTGSPNVGIINSTYGLDGCAQPLQSVGSEGVISPPPYPASGSTPTKGTPLKIIYRNDTGAVLPKGTSFNIGVTLDGKPSSQLFDSKLIVTFRGFVNLADGSLDTSDGIGGTMPDVGGDITWKYGDRTALFLHKDLPAGAGYYVEIALCFTTSQFEGRLLKGSQIQIAIAPAAQSGDIAYALWQFTGDIVFSDDGQLRVVPGVGLSADILGGSALIKRFVFPSRGRRSIYGLLPNTANQKVTLDGNGSLFFRGVGEVPVTERIRALISTEIGYSRPSAWSEAVTVSDGGSLSVALNYPCDDDGYGTIRGDYPVLGGMNEGKFNSPYVHLFVKRSSDGQVFWLQNAVNVLFDTTQTVAVGSLNGAFTVASLPSPPHSNFCLFAPPTLGVAPSSNGSLPADTYSVAAAYYLNGNVVSSISHNPLDSCIAEVDGMLSDLFAIRWSWGEAVDADSVRDIKAVPWQTRRLAGTNKKIYFNPSSRASDDGVRAWLPDYLDEFEEGRWLEDKPDFDASFPLPYLKLQMLSAPPSTGNAEVALFVDVAEPKKLKMRFASNGEITVLGNSISAGTTWDTADWNSIQWSKI